MQSFKLNTVLLALVTASLTACGGGSSDSNNTSGNQADLTGVAIDGYVEGATAFVDYNLNGQLDDNEPSALTDQNGQFEFSGVDGVCADYAPIIINVPVGAYDSDYGVVSEAYQLTFPPKFSSNYSNDILNTTPFTTVIWNAIKTELSELGAEGCQALAANSSLQGKIKQRVAEQEYRLANRYNIAVSDLYGDFIKQGNTVQHQLAQSLTIGLAKAYEETRAFEALYPDAHVAYVEYWLGNPASDDISVADTWYRKEYVGHPEYAQETVYQVSNDLDTIVTMTHYLKTNTTLGQYNDSETFVVMDEDTSNSYPSSAYHCTKQLRANQKGNTVGDVYYEFAINAQGGVNDAAECEALDIDANRSGTPLTAMTKDQYGRYITYAQFDFESGDNANVDGLNYALTNQLIDASTAFDGVSTISPEIDLTEGYGALSWIRSAWEYLNDGSMIYTEHRSTGLWIVTNTAANGTYSVSCGLDKTNLTVMDMTSCLNLVGH